MKKPRILLSSPHMGGTEQDFINRAFKENWIAPLGPNVNGFEEDIKNYILNSFPSGGGREGGAIATLSSGTAALHLALIQLGVQAGDEVLCQSFTFVASVNPITYLGATPVLIDSEKDTLNLCSVQLKKAIKDRIAKGKKPKVIIAVHLYGIPYKVDEINAIASEFDILVIEDSAEALGSTYKGKACGTFGTFGILSFNSNKIITSGGALVCLSEEINQQTIFYATQARDNGPHYQHSKIGYNYCLSNVSAGIGRGQMQVITKRVAARRAMHEFYIDLFAGIDGVTVFKVTNDDYYSNYWLSVIFIDENKTGGINREKLRLYLETYNIESRPLWKPMHLQPVYKDAPFYGTGVAEGFFKTGLCLPSGSNLTEVEKGRIEKAVKDCFLGL